MKDPRGNYHLEFAQRDFYSLTDEPMEFNEETIARVLDEIVEESGDVGHGLFLKAMARALRGTDHEFRLRLSLAKRGKFKSSNDHTEEMERKQAIYMHVLFRQGEGDPKEAAVAHAAETFKISRASVFKLMRELDDFHELLNEFRESNSKFFGKDRNSPSG